MRPAGQSLKTHSNVLERSLLAGFRDVGVGCNRENEEYTEWKEVS